MYTEAGAARAEEEDAAFHAIAQAKIDQAREQTMKEMLQGMLTDNPEDYLEDDLGSDADWDQNAVEQEW